MDAYIVKPRNPSQKPQLSLPEFRKMQEEIRFRRGCFNDITVSRDVQLHLVIAEEGLVVAEIREDDVLHIHQNAGRISDELREHQRQEKFEKRKEFLQRVEEAKMDRPGMSIVKIIDWEDFEDMYGANLTTDFERFIGAIKTVRADPLSLVSTLQLLSNTETMIFSRELKFMYLAALVRGQKPDVRMAAIILNDLTPKQMISVGRWSSPMLDEYYKAANAEQLIKMGKFSVGRECKILTLPLKIRYFGLTYGQSALNMSSMLVTSPMAPRDDWTAIDVGKVNDDF